MTVSSYVDAARNAKTAAQSSFTQLVEPTPETLNMKTKAMEIRRSYKAFIVAGIAVLSVLPAIRAGPGKVEKARIAVRNFIFFGGGSTFLLYPEFAFPAIERTHEAVASNGLFARVMAPKS